jgi:hypothetical protein
MTMDRKLALHGTPLMTVVATALLLAVSSLCGILCVEALFRIYTMLLPAKHFEYKWDKRIMFFGSGDTVFENKSDIFTYSPHKDIRSLATYFNEYEFNIEYDYRFHTNNFGLVQEADIFPNVDSMLLLGDSFTEGQGAAPWFRHIAGEITNLGYQPINGGLAGTGFAQWSKLEDYLTAQSIRIKKIVVLFISDDYNRNVWNFPDQVLHCLSVPASCRGEEGVYPLPSMEALPSWVNRIENARRIKPFKDRVKAMLPASYSVYHFVTTDHEAQRRSDVAIVELIRKYGTMNVIFIQLPQKDEVNGVGMPRLGARRTIEKAGGQLFDGMTLCDLTPSDYHENDGHPNEKGYEKIALCTIKIINNMRK